MVIKNSYNGISVDIKRKCRVKSTLMKTSEKIEVDLDKLSSKGKLYQHPHFSSLMIRMVSQLTHLVNLWKHQIQRQRQDQITLMSTDISFTDFLNMKLEVKLKYLHKESCNS